MVKLLPSQSSHLSRSLLIQTSGQLRITGTRRVKRRKKRQKMMKTETKKHRDSESNLVPLMRERSGGTRKLSL